MLHQLSSSAHTCTASLAALCPPHWQVVSAAELAHTMELLSKLATRVSGGNAVLQLVEEARRVSM